MAKPGVEIELKAEPFSMPAVPVLAFSRFNLKWRSLSLPAQLFRDVLV
jgi:hypothetical protein